MKSKFTLFPLLCICLFSLFSCNNSSEEPIAGQNTIRPEYIVNEADLESKILTIAHFERIEVSSSVYKKNNAAEEHSLIIELINPTYFPATDSVFNEEALEIKQLTIQALKNIEEYEKLMIGYKQLSTENGIDKNRTYRTEFELNIQ